MEPEWELSLPNICSRPTGCHGNDLMPIEPCDTIDSLLGQRGVFDPIWEVLTFTHGGLDDGHPGPRF